jgi:ubiquinone/menaquinone biosynthesis C-methylase UbiE
MLEYVILVFILVVMYYISLWDRGREGFENGKTRNVEDFYDSFYSEFYKDLWHSSKEAKDFEQVSIQEALLAGKQKNTLKVLDMCCGVAVHSCLFKQLDVEYLGVDLSEDMLSQARKGCPNQKFQRGDITDATLFQPKSFSSAMLLGFSIYEFSNPKILSDNAFMWIEPGGSLIVHMIDPDKFDPLLDLASPFAAFSLQKYSYERQKKSEIYFHDFKYTGQFNKNPDEDNATFDELFTFFNPVDDIKYREQTHKLNMPSLERLVNIFQSSGFRVQEKIDLVSVGKEYQYLVVFSK